MSTQTFAAKAVTQGPKHHFFGYYGICPWNATGQYLLCLESEFHERPPAAEDSAVVGLVELATGKFEPLAETRAWNLQQGCMLHWLPTAPEREIVYNDRQGDRHVAVVMDIHTGKKRVLPRAVSGLSRDGRLAASLNYARLKSLRPVVGYAGLPDFFADQNHPEDDGIYLMDIESGEAEILVSYEEARALLSDYEDVQTHKLWFNHTVINRDDTRIAFVVRLNEPGIQIKHTFLVTASLKGGDLRVMTDVGASHFDWQSESTLISWLTMGAGYNWYRIDEPSGEYELLRPDIMTRDGHNSFTKDGTWMLTDTGPDADHQQSLMLWNMVEERLVPLGKFESLPPFRGEIRCDMHPRWSRDERQVCFDSIHEGTRQVYVMDVSAALDQ